MDKYTRMELDEAGVYISYRPIEDVYIVWGTYTYGKFTDHDAALEYALDRSADILATEGPLQTIDDVL